MSITGKSILKTIVYYDCLDYPLTKEELEFFSFKNENGPAKDDLIESAGGFYFLKGRGKLLKIRKEIEANFRRIKDKDLSKLSDREFLKEFKKYIELEQKERRVAGCADSFIFYSERRLAKLLNGFENKNEAMEVLARPVDPSLLNEAEMELIKIAEKLKKGVNIERLIRKHIDKYCWIKGSFVGGKEYAFEDALKEAKKLAKKDLKKEVERNEIWKKNAKTKEDFVADHRFNKEILAIKDLSSVFAKLQDVRKESTLIAAYLHSKFLSELARRRGAKIENLLMLCDYAEINSFVKRELTEDILNKRREAGFLVVFHKNEYRIFDDEKTISYIKNILRVEDKDVEEFPGTIASSGKTAGKARIVMNEKDVSKFEEGEILVSTMTRPDHIVAMKKAAAIITNEGGITCHAAIISRELGIPCIIGTKIATKVLKDGDLVEVDADRGVVKILEKKE